MDPAWVLSLRDEASIAEHDQGELAFLGPSSSITLRQLSPGQRAALRRLAPPGETAGRLTEDVYAIEGPAGLARWNYHLHALAKRQLLCLSACDGATRLATLEPTAPSFVFLPGELQPDRHYVLSRFAWLRRSGEALHLESPLRPARIVLHDPRAAVFVHALVHSDTVEGIRGRVAGLSADAVTPLLGLLLEAGAVCIVDENGKTFEDLEPALSSWQFHDLLFHARSRQGRNDSRLGATYPMAGRFDPPPAIQPAASVEGVPLQRPDLDQLQHQDPPLAFVQENRRSIRKYADEPIAARQIGEFLYRVARVKNREQVELETPAGPVEFDFAYRPYPNGGGIYELEVYVAVKSCSGLPPGLYHYDGVAHKLALRAGNTPEVQRLLAEAAQAAAMEPTQAQVLFVLAARLPRLAWKYSGLAYALSLKHVGVVFQTMYLAATAMGLAPCALGLGDSDLFSRAAGVDYYAETSVGEFLLGSRRSAD